MHQIATVVQTVADVEEHTFIDVHDLGFGPHTASNITVIIVCQQPGLDLTSDRVAAIGPGEPKVIGPVEDRMPFHQLIEIQLSLGGSLLPDEPSCTGNPCITVAASRKWIPAFGR